MPLRVIISLTEPYDSAIAHYGLMLARVLHEHGAEITVITVPGTHPDRKARAAAMRGAGYTVLNAPARTYNPLTYLRLIRRLLACIPVSGSTTAILLRPELTPALWIIKRWFRPTLRTVRIRGEAREFRNNAINRYLYGKFFDRVVFTSKLMQHRHIANIPTPFRNSVLIYSPVDTEFFQKPADFRTVRGSFGIKPADKVVTVFGRLDPVKGHCYFLEALALAQKKFNGTIKGLIIGREEHTRIAELKDRARQLGIAGDCIFTGHVADARPLLADTDIGIVSSIGSEIVCRVAIEFFSLGVPVIATDAGVLPEIIQPGVTGFTVPSADPAALAERMVALLTDDNQRREMGRNARALAIDRYALPVFYQAWMNVLADVNEVC